MKRIIPSIVIGFLVPFFAFFPAFLEAQDSGEPTLAFLTQPKNCLSNFSSVSQIDELKTLVSRLRIPENSKQRNRVRTAVRQINSLLGTFGSTLRAESEGLTLKGGVALFTTHLANVEQAVRRARKFTASDFKKRKKKALAQLALLRGDISEELISCDDGSFCNGIESCNVNAGGACVAGSNPCSGVQVCNDSAAICSIPPGETFNLTLNIDSFTGTVLDDLFIANLVFNPNTATTLPSLQTGDNLNGADGNDSLTATFNFGVTTTVTPQINSVETMTFNDLGTAETTIAFDLITGVQTINLTGSINSNPMDFINLPAAVDVGISNQSVGASLFFQSSATSGANDVTTLTLANFSLSSSPLQSIVNYLTASINGFETLNIQSNGAQNRLTRITQSGGETLATINVSGAAPFSLARDSLSALPQTVTVLNASASSGGVDLTFGGTQNVTVNGGSGNDVFNFAGTYTTGDSVNGGGGINTLGLNAAQAVVAAAQTNVSNIQNLMIVNTLLTENVDISRFGATDVILDSTGNSLLLNLPSTIAMPSGNRTFTMINDDVNDQLNITLSGVGVNDTLSIFALNSDQSFGTTRIAPIGAEVVNYFSSNGPDGTPADGGENSILGLNIQPTVGTGTLNILGDVPFRVQQEIRASFIDASLLAASFRMTTTTASISNLITGVTINGSSFDDDLVGGNGGTNFVNGNAGNDRIKGLDGTDLLFGGAGADDFLIDAISQFGDVLADFNPAEDQILLSSGIINFTGVTGTENAPVTLTAANFETGRSQVSVIAAGDSLKVIRLINEQTSAQLTGVVGGAATAYVLAFDSTLQRGVLFHDANWADVAGRARVALLDSITTNLALQSITFSNFAEID